MRKVDAIKMANVISKECDLNKDCVHCPFYFKDNFSYSCLLVYISNESYNQKVFDILLSEAQKEEEEKLKNTKEMHLHVSNVERLKAAMLEVEKKDEPHLNLAHDAIIPSGVTVKKDNVNSPSYYCKGGMEGIDAIKAAVSNLSSFEAVCVANIIKYVWRYKDKNGLEDLKKAEHYLEWLIDEVEKNGNSTKVEIQD